MSTRPATAVRWPEGGAHWVDPVMAAMLTELARLAAPRGIRIRLIQGSWSTSTSASGSTHDGSGVADVDAETMTDDQAAWVETTWRRLGGFGWFRKPIYRADGSKVWQRHLHLGRNGPGMAAALATQHTDYLEGWNGLPIGNRTHRDTGTRAYVGVTWADYLRERENDDMARYTEWDAYDRRALVNDVVSGILGKSIQSGLQQETVGQAIGRTSARTRTLVADEDQVDVAALARELAPLLPAGTVVTQADLVGALRELLGSLDTAEATA